MGPKQEQDQPSTSDTAHTQTPTPQLTSSLGALVECGADRGEVQPGDPNHRPATDGADDEELKVFMAGRRSYDEAS
jgi:hypothetical protein